MVTPSLSHNLTVPSREVETSTQTPVAAAPRMVVLAERENILTDDIAMAMEIHAHKLPTHSLSPQERDIKRARDDDATQSLEHEWQRRFMPTNSCITTVGREVPKLHARYKAKVTTTTNLGAAHLLITLPHPHASNAWPPCAETHEKDKK